MQDAITLHDSLSCDLNAVTIRDHLWHKGVIYPHHLVCELPTSNTDGTAARHPKPSTTPVSSGESTARETEDDELMALEQDVVVLRGQKDMLRNAIKQHINGLYDSISRGNRTTKKLLLAAERAVLLASIADLTSRLRDLKDIDG